MHVNFDFICENNRDQWEIKKVSVDTHFGKADAYIGGHSYRNNVPQISLMSADLFNL